MNDAYRFSFGPWTCTDTRNGLLFTGPSTILVRRGENRRLTVQRTWLDRFFNVHPAPYGNPFDGGEQGGGGIDLYPRWKRGNREAMDGTIERHAIGWPFPPPGLRYPLTLPGPGPYAMIDGPHYIRAYSHAVAQYAHDKDPVARMWLDLCALEVQRRFPLAPFTDHEGPEYSLASMIESVHATPHTGDLGIAREVAWCLRCVVEKHRAHPERWSQVWIERFIGMLYLGQTESGAVERHDFGQGLSQEEDDARALGMMAGQEWCTGWQWPFVAVAVREAMRVVPGCWVHGLEILRRFKAMYDGCPKVPGDVYDGIPTAPGLPRYLIVAENGVVLPRITRGVGPARAAYDGFAFQAFAEVGLT